MAAHGDLYPGWEDEVWRAAEPDVRARAEAVLDWADRTAPVDTGEYKSKLIMIKIPGGSRGFRIVAWAEHSIFVEFGTRYMAPYHTLAIALDAAKGPAR